MTFGDYLLLSICDNQNSQSALRWKTFFLICIYWGVCVCVSHSANTLQAQAKKDVSPFWQHGIKERCCKYRKQKFPQVRTDELYLLNSHVWKQANNVYFSFNIVIDIILIPVSPICCPLSLVACSSVFDHTGCIKFSLLKITACIRVYMLSRVEIKLGCENRKCCQRAWRVLWTIK